METLTKLMGSLEFHPHGQCLLWNSELVWLHVIADSLIALAYYSIPVALLYFVQKRKDLPFPWVFIMFGAFILACGTTHLMGVWTMWQPVYWLDGGVKTVTAGVSLVSAGLLWPLIPKALSLPSPTQLEQANRDLRQEIAQHQATYQALQESQRRFQLLIDGARDYAIFMLDPDGKVISWNEGAERIKGYRAEEILGKHFSCFYPPEDRRGGKPEEKLAKALREGRVEDEGWRIRKDGSSFWANVVVTAVYDYGNRLQGFAKVTRDITERKQVEAQLRQAEKLASLGILLGGVAHELKNPLFVVRGNVQLAQQALHDGAQEDLSGSLVAIDEAGQQALGTVERFLETVRSSGHRREMCRISEVLSNTLKLIAHDFSINQISVDTDIPPDLPSVLADPGELEEVFLNLFVNAKQAILSVGDQGHITVRACAIEEGNRIRITVSDDGPGIDPAVLPRIFDPFFTTKAPGQGTGLGLSICHRIIIQLGGGLTCTSAGLNEGATFTFELPGARRSHAEDSHNRR